MKQSQFNGIVAQTISNIQSLLEVKGGEYAGSEDRLANFKRGATLTGCTALQCAFIYASKHYDAISTYIRKDAAGEVQVLSEPIEGRLDDLINYCLLLKGLVQEAGEDKILHAQVADFYSQNVKQEVAGQGVRNLDAKETAMISNLVQSGAMIPVTCNGVLVRYEIAPEATEFFLKDE